MNYINCVISFIIFNIISSISFLVYTTLFLRYNMFENIYFHLVLMISAGETLCCIITLPTLISFNENTIEDISLAWC